MAQLTCWHADISLYPPAQTWEPAGLAGRWRPAQGGQGTVFLQLALASFWVESGKEREGREEEVEDQADWGQHPQICGDCG